jgi:glycosyltransferase involved in cell wall biosynthesis
MKKIVILVDQLHSHGGIEKLVAIKASYWADVFGFQVTILATEQVGKAIIYPISKKVTFIDLAINYNRSKSYFSIQNLLKLFKNILKVQKILREGKIDFAIVASHIPITYLLPFIPTKTKKIKEFHFSRTIKTGSFSDKFMDYIESKYDSLIVLSDEEKKFFKTNNVIVIPNPLLPLDHYILKKSSEKENLAIFAGRLAPVKNLEKLEDYSLQIN